MRETLSRQLASARHQCGKTAEAHKATRLPIINVGLTILKDGAVARACVLRVAPQRLQYPAPVRIQCRKKKYMMASMTDNQTH